MRLTPRRPIGVLGLWHVGPGASRAASRGQWIGIRRAYTQTRTHDPPPCQAASGPWQAGGLPCVLAASPANRCMPTCFGPGPARLPTHPTSTAPTTRHDLASVQRTGGDSHGFQGGGIRFPTHWLSPLRKQGSNAQPALVERWIPAFAGMTAGGWAPTRAHKLDVIPAEAGIHPEGVRVQRWSRGALRMGLGLCRCDPVDGSGHRNKCLLVRLRSPPLVPC